MYEPISLEALKQIKFYCGQEAASLDVSGRFSEPLGLSAPIYQCCSTDQQYFILTDTPEANPDLTVLPDRKIFNTTLSIRAFPLHIDYSSYPEILQTALAILPGYITVTDEMRTLAGLKHPELYKDEYNNYFLMACREFLFEKFSLVLDNLRQQYPGVLAFASGPLETIGFQSELQYLFSVHPNIQFDIFYKEGFVSVFFFKTLDSSVGFLGLLNRLSTVSVPEQDAFMQTLETIIKIILV